MPTNRLILRNVNVLDGENPSAKNRTVVVDGERISSVQSETPTVSEGDTVVDLDGCTVMPGMGLCHFHSTYTSSMNPAPAPFGYDYPPAYQALIAHRNLVTALEHGYTIIVSAGAASDVEPQINQAIEDRFVPGPRLTPCGKELSTTGHLNDLLAPWYWHVPELGAGRNCDGAEEFTRAIREEVKMGVKIVKLFVTRGHLVPGRNSFMEMTRDELRAAIETAHARDILIRGHLTGKKAIMMAIEFGIDIVDHCDEMDDEVIAALAENGTFVVPSIHYPKLVADLVESHNPKVATELRQSVRFMCDAIHKAEAAGVRLLLGDDYGGWALRHGEYGDELRTYVDHAELSPLTVIRWATRNAAALIRRQDDLGTLEAGKIADLLVLDGDPSGDIGALSDSRPRAVLKGGELVAGSLPGMSVREYKPAQATTRQVPSRLLHARSAALD